MFATKYCLVIGHSGDGGGDYIALHLRTVLVEIDDNYKSQHIFCLFFFAFIYPFSFVFQQNLFGCVFFYFFSFVCVFYI